MFVPGIRPIAEARAELDALVQRRFEDGDRFVVPVLGTGVNLQAANEVGATALNWKQLLLDIERQEGIVWEGPPPRSLTARWEALLQRQSSFRASEREEALVGRVVEALERQTTLIWERADGKAPPLYADLLAKRFRDFINLNFDDRLARAGDGAALFRPASPKGMKMRPGSAFSVLPQMYQRTHLRAPGFTRIWHPHGRTASRSTIVLGIGCYGRLVPDLDLSWQRYKAAEREFGEAKTRDHALFPEPTPRRQWSPSQVTRWLEHRRAVGPLLANGKPAKRVMYRRPFDALSWLDVFLCSPLLFVGCSLGSDEFPLWWALHQRARNQARLPPERREPAVLLTAQPKPRALDHLRGGPSGLSTVVFATWADLWSWIRSV